MCTDVSNDATVRLEASGNEEHRAIVKILGFKSVGTIIPLEQPLVLEPWVSAGKISRNRPSLIPPILLFLKHPRRRSSRLLLLFLH
ncbi:MAG: hypothetical protein ACFFCS_26765 [Candidatus Hodarchaeota archaeon]